MLLLQYTRVVISFLTKNLTTSCRAWAKLSKFCKLYKQNTAPFWKVHFNITFVQNNHIITHNFAQQQRKYSHSFIFTKLFLNIALDTCKLWPHKKKLKTKQNYKYSSAYIWMWLPVSKGYFGNWTLQMANKTKVK